MNGDMLKQLDHKFIMSTYKRYDLLIERGEGCYVFDQSGKKYLDFVGGIATCSVGHGNTFVTEAISAQAGKMISVSNLYYSEPPIRLAAELVRLSGLNKVFFCHSGTEANETAVKVAKKVTGKSEFIAFTQAFHGRTTGSLALTWNERYKTPFAPLTPKVHFARYNEASSIRPLISDKTAAIIVEPIQGEAGIIVPDKGFLKEVRKLCDTYGLCMIVDEVQTGVGRTGRFFAYEHEGVTPDIVTIAKGLANGVPIGACISRHSLDVGEHGSTLGGNSLSAAAALATIDYIERHQLMENAEHTGRYIMEKVRNLSKDSPLIDAVRGKGLMIGIVLKRPLALRISEDCLKMGLLCNAPTADVIRLLPPLIARREEADECMDILSEVLSA